MGSFFFLNISLPCLAVIFIFQEGVFPHDLNPKMTLSPAFFDRQLSSRKTQPSQQQHQQQRRAKKADDEVEVQEKESEDEVSAKKKKKAIADLSADLQKLDELVSESFYWF